MILTVSGWRDWVDDAFAERHFYPFYRMYGSGLYVRAGGAKGLDTFISSFCDTQGIVCTVYRADWGGLGKAAGPIRNRLMLRGEGNPLDPHPGVLSDRLLAFPQPGINWKTDKSGTVGCILEAVELGVHVDVPGYKK